MSITQVDDFDRAARALLKLPKPRRDATCKHREAVRAAEFYLHRLKTECCGDNPERYRTKEVDDR